MLQTTHSHTKIQLQKLKILLDFFLKYKPTIHLNENRDAHARRLLARLPHLRCSKTRNNAVLIPQEVYQSNGRVVSSCKQVCSNNFSKTQL